MLGLGRCPRVGGVLYALVQHELKRLLAFHSIENVGIVALGLGASLVFASHGQRDVGAIAFAAALLHTLNHAVFKALLFLGAGRVQRARSAVSSSTASGGLLRRMPWTGGAFLVGSMAIAGLPPLNGFASEWLTLQALLHVAVVGPLGVALAGALATAGARRDRGARGVLLRQGGRAGAARRAARGRSARGAARRRPGCGRALVFLAGCASLLGRGARPAGPLARRSSGPARASLPHEPGLAAPGHRVACRPLALAAGARGARGRRSAAAPARPPRRAGAGLGLRPADRARAGIGARPASPSRCGWCWRRCCGPGARSSVRARRGVAPGASATTPRSRTCSTRCSTGRCTRGALRGAAVARRLQSGSVRAYLVYLLALLALLLALARAGVLA